MSRVGLDTSTGVGGRRWVGLEVWEVQVWSGLRPAGSARQSQRYKAESLRCFIGVVYAAKFAAWEMAWVGVGWRFGGGDFSGLSINFSTKLKSGRGRETLRCGSAVWRRCGPATKGAAGFGYAVRRDIYIRLRGIFAEIFTARARRVGGFGWQRGSGFGYAVRRDIYIRLRGIFAEIFTALARRVGGFGWQRGSGCGVRSSRCGVRLCRPARYVCQAPWHKAEPGARCWTMSVTPWAGRGSL